MEPSNVMPEPDPSERPDMVAARWLVDGMNVIGARAGGWWRDPDRAIRNLIDELRDFADATGEPVVVVFDYRPKGFRPGARGLVKARFAGGGPQAADELIASIVREDPGYRVVTSDRALRDLVRAAGAEVEGAGGFWKRLDAALRSH